MHGLSHQMFSKDRPDLDAFLLDAVVQRRPDVLVFCGWLFWPYTRLASAPALSGVRKVMGMDTPWRGTLAHRLARWRLSHFVDAMDLVVTAGERGAEYARRIGVPERRLRSGYYGFDYDEFHAAGARRPQPWPRQFLFVGRYVPEKDLQTLVSGYAAYRAGVERPWGLTCCGTGPDASQLTGVEGVVNAGFIQPRHLAEMFSAHGAFVLPSRFEPWGVVIAEAAGSGLPVICSSACGAAIEVVRPYYNGLVIAPGDGAGLARAFRWIHDHEDDLPLMGRRGAALSHAFSAEVWALRWHNYFLDALQT